MKRVLFLMILMWLLNLPVVLGQTPTGKNWLISSEISPTSRTNAYKKLPQAQSDSNWEWRNQFGKFITPNLVVGLSAGLRTYSISETVNVVDSNYSSDYLAKVENTLWQGGVFLTRFFSLSPRWKLQSTLYGTYEQGRGDYDVELLGYNCSACFSPGGQNRNFTLGSRFERELRERNFYTGVDFGVSYLLTPSVSLQTSLNLFQFETFESFFPRGQQLNPDRASYRPIEQQGNGFSTVINRPIVHFGFSLLL
ncbi:hypothetical protein KI659_07190 [Litoribacter alkaliphilus]|uniref:Uncharacterized protein n=1 Tax=Litoribacter ruber TaxID=702568 RepID=A0AAP2CL18_9BACT|nr:hypothetical protein [Litoribacter alkaliphilus]MBS9523797.1 hypothetical protein [Litoribacter alkaliphilus]